MKCQAIIVLALTTSLFAQLDKKSSTATQASPTTMKLSPTATQVRMHKLVVNHRSLPVAIPIAFTRARLQHQDVMLKLQQQKQTVETLRMTILSSARNRGQQSAQAIGGQRQGGAGIEANQDAVNPDPKGSPGAQSGQRIASQSRIPSVAAAHPGPTTHVSPVVNSNAAAFAVCHGPTISAVNGRASDAWFTPDPQYNHYTIQGCGFGDLQGSLHLYGPFAVPTVNLTVEYWTDTSILVALDPNLSGEPDHLGNVTLVVAPANGPQVQAKGFNFYAARAEVQLATMPQSQANPQKIMDAAGANTVSISFFSPGSYAPGTTAEIYRSDGGRFGSATDSFSFSQLAPGFYPEKAQFWHFDLTPNDCTAGGAAFYVDGNWSAAWDNSGNGLRVTTQEQHCHTTGMDYSMSDYALTVWVVGPRGVNPWGTHP